jgi:hypothetical protein
MPTEGEGVFFTVHRALPLLARGAAVVLTASINVHKGMPRPCRPTWSSAESG